MTEITCIDELRDLHRRRVPKMFFEYADAGSWSEQTLRANRADFQKIGLRQRVGRDIAERSTRSTMLGQPVAMPLALCPVGLLGMQAPDGEIKAARAAERFGVPFTLSTMSICSVEDVAAHTKAPFWFQLYVTRDADFQRRLLQRVRQAGCSALVVTLDLPVQGQRHVDIKNGLTAPPRLTPANLLNIASRPGWALGMLRTKRRVFGNLMGHVEGLTDFALLAQWVEENFDQSLTWDKLAQVKADWGGKMIVKGILDAEDAKQAIAAGADALIVSNHGGRQLDGARSTISVLEEIVAAVGGRAEIYLDGGIRSGQDLMKALSLGATGGWIGRAYVHGLGAMGEAGVTKALELIHRELDLSMALSGLCRIDQFSPADLLIPEDFPTRYRPQVAETAARRTG